MDVLLRQPPNGDPRERRPRWLVGIMAGVLVVAAAVAVVLGTLRESTPLSLDAPAGVVQAYLQAILDRDVATARTWLTQDVAARCSAAELRQAWVPEGLTASLSEVRTSTSEAEVEIRLRGVAGPEPFGGGDVSTTEVFTLERDEGAWRIATDPWPVYDCGGRS